jgi:hypothetical protein
LRVARVVFACDPVFRFDCPPTCAAPLRFAAIARLRGENAPIVERPKIAA